MISSDEDMWYMPKIHGLFEYSPSDESLFKSIQILLFANSAADNTISDDLQSETIQHVIEIIPVTFETFEPTELEHLKI